MLIALLLASALLLEAAQAAHFAAAPEGSPWESAAQQGMRLSATLLPRLKSFAEKRHQSLLPYHPVVRFRGLGGPGEWPEADLLTTSFRQIGAPVIPTELDSVMMALQEVTATRGESFENELQEALDMNAGNLLKALEAMALKQANSVTGIRFGIRR